MFAAAALLSGVCAAPFAWPVCPVPLLCTAAGSLAGGRLPRPLAWGAGAESGVGAVAPVWAVAPAAVMPPTVMSLLPPSLSSLAAKGAAGACTGSCAASCACSAGIMLASGCAGGWGGWGWAAASCAFEDWELAACEFAS